MAWNRYSAIRSTCKECQNRYGGCHDTCAEYQAARDEHVKMMIWLRTMNRARVCDLNVRYLKAQNQWRSK